MKIEIRKKQIFERKADSSGRISLPSKQFAGKKLEVCVLDEVEDSSDEKAEENKRRGWYKLPPPNTSLLDQF